MLTAKKLMLVCLLAAAGGAPLLAGQIPRGLLQAPKTPCPVYTSPAVNEHIDRAFALIGRDLPKGLIPNLFIVPRGAGLCAPKRVPLVSLRSQVVAPIKAFDQFYYVGDTFVGTWILKTSGGLVLFDAMWTPEQGQQIVEKGIRDLGLDPADIKYLVITHGHIDHFGGGKYLQDKYHMKVWIGKGDAALLNVPSAPGVHMVPPPSVDHEITDGDVLTLGSTAIRFHISPGHTPGSISALIPVTDRGAPHLVGLFGGFGLPSSLEPDDRVPPRHSGLLAYISSMQRFRAWGEAAGADVVLSTHPIFDDTIRKGATWRRSGPNPWVLGKAGWVRYVRAAEEVARTVEAMQREHPVAKSR